METSRKSFGWLAAIVLTQCITLLSVWKAIPSQSGVRAETIPDAGAQRDELIEQTRITNEKLDKIIAILANGDLHVTVKAPDADKH